MSPDKQTLNELRIDRAAPRAKAKTAVVVVVLLVLLVISGGVIWWIKRPKAASVRTVLIEAPVASGGGETLLNASGYVTARREATVASKVTGKVVEVLIEEGMKVE